MIIAHPGNIIKAKRTNSFFRNVREHRKLNLLRELKNVDLPEITKHDKDSDKLSR